MRPIDMVTPTINLDVRHRKRTVMNQKMNARLQRLLDREVKHLKGCAYEVLRSYPASSTVARLHHLIVTVLRTPYGNGQGGHIVVQPTANHWLGFRTTISDGFVKHSDGTLGPLDKDEGSESR